MADPMNKRILTIRKGEELQVSIDDKIDDPSSYSYPAYRQAMRALAGIVQRSNSFHKSLDAENTERHREDLLFSYGSNVIAFSAQKGGGKTSTMLSFSSYLDGYGIQGQPKEMTFLEEDEANALQGIRFHTIAPISPSALMEKQSILSVILTRLYRYAMELQRPQPSNHYPNGIYSDSHRDNLGYGYNRGQEVLHELFQNCLNGIQGIRKQRFSDQEDDLLELEELSDGLILIRHFYHLVQKILDIHARKTGAENHYLVLQIDDADSQVGNGFEILEDVRKYLQIPNLIILMSTDMDLMHEVLLENYREQFKHTGDVERLSRMCRKYIDKVVPPSQLVSLSPLNTMMDQSTYPVHLEYQNSDGTNALEWAKEKDMDLQDALLMLIHRKTGIVFARPNSYPHNILPVTMRGLNQLLKLLTNMKDIPLLEDNDKNFASAEHTAEAFRKRIVIQEDNLTKFSDYFTRTWIPAKVTNLQDRKFLGELSDSVSAEYVAMTIDYLQARYFNESTPASNLKMMKSKLDSPDPDPTTLNNPVYNQVYLDTLMVVLRKTQSSVEDYYLLFAIRTLFTLNHHKMILRQQWNAYVEFSELNQEGKAPPFFAVDYNPAVTHLAKGYAVNTDIAGLAVGVSIYQPEGKVFAVGLLHDEVQEYLKGKQTDKNCTLLQECFVCKNAKNEDIVSFTGFITLLLRLGANEVIPNTQETLNSSDRRKIFLAQEAALVIAANWEVQDQIYKKMRLSLTEKVALAENNLIVNFDSLFNAMDTVLAEIGNTHLCSYHRRSQPVEANTCQPWSIKSGYDLLTAFAPHEWKIDNNYYAGLFGVNTFPPTSSTPMENPPENACQTQTLPTQQPGPPGSNEEDTTP